MSRPRRRIFRVACAGLVAMGGGGCAAYISPLQPPPYRDHVAAPYDVTWAALIQALAYDNVPVRTVAKDSGVISSDDIVSPIGVYADCGSKGDKPLEGEALVTFIVFVRPNGQTTELQINSKMRTFRLGKPRKLPELVKRARRLATERDRLVQELAKEWATALRGQGFSARDLEELWAGLTEEAVRRLLQTDARQAGAEAIRHEAREVIARVRTRVETELAPEG